MQSDAGERHGPGAVQRVRKLVSSHGIDAKLHRRTVLAQPKAGSKSTESDAPDMQASASSEDPFSSEREMLLAAVEGLREAAEAAMRRAEAAEAACFAPMKLALEAHLKEYKEHMASEIRSTLQQEISEATAELRATARELCVLCRSPLQTAAGEAASHVPEGLSFTPCRQPAKAADFAPSRLDPQHHTLPSLGLSGEGLEVKRSAHEHQRGSNVFASAPEALFTASISEVTPARARVMQLHEDAVHHKEVGPAEEEDIDARRRRSVRDVVSHFEKVNRNLPFTGAAGSFMSGSSSVERLVPASSGNEVGGRSASHGMPSTLHEPGKGFQLPGLTPQTSKEDLDAASHANLLRRKSI